jgi:hypothetical protein
MVKLFEEEIHIMQLFYANQSILEMCVTFPMQHMIGLSLFQSLFKIYFFEHFSYYSQKMMNSPYYFGPPVLIDPV